LSILLGPTGGEIIRPSDRKHVEKILFVLCVGSRDERHEHHCSRFCCMYSIKHAYQAIDHGIQDVTVLYMDVRAYGKGFDGFWQRTTSQGAKFIHGRPARISDNGDGKISVVYENIGESTRVTDTYDMVVLANAVTPPDGLDELAARLGIAVDPDGFIHANETAGGLVMTTRQGIYTAGCVSGPKDIPDSVAEGSAAAGLSMRHLSARYWPEAASVEPIPNIEIPRVGVFVCHCGSNIAGVVDVERVTEYAKTLPDVIYAGHQMFSCAGNTQAEIEETIRREGITRVVIAACSPKTHESIFRDVLTRAGLNPYLLEMSNIRNMDSWVHKSQKEDATIKAMEMVAMAVEKARLLTPLTPSHLEVQQSALVIGGGIAGMTAASALAQQGFTTHLVEKEDHLGGLLNQLGTIAPAGIHTADMIAAKVHEVEMSHVQVHLNTTIEMISGLVGDFSARLSNGENLRVGAVVVATGAAPYHPSEFDYGQDPRVITNLELEKYILTGNLTAKRVTFISCVGSRQGNAGCSRYCCSSMIHQALELRRMGKHVRIISKDIRTYSRNAEELYKEAMKAGVQFFRYEDVPPQEAITWQDGQLIFRDELLGQKLRLSTDLLVLVVGLVPSEDTLSDQLNYRAAKTDSIWNCTPNLVRLKPLYKEFIWLAPARARRISANRSPVRWRRLAKRALFSPVVKSKRNLSQPNSFPSFAWDVCAA